MRRTDVVVQTHLRANDATSPQLVRMARLARGAAGAVRGIGGAVAGITAAAGVAALAIGGIGLALTRVAGTVSERGDEFAKLSREVGISADLLQRLEFVAGRQGATYENVANGLGAFSRRMGQLQGETGSLYTELRRLDPAFLSQLSGIEDNEEAFGVYLNRLSQVESESRRAALAAAAFGRTAGADVTRMLDGGPEAFRALMEEAGRLRSPLGADALADAEEYQDRLLDFRTVIAGVRDDLGQRLIPVLSQTMQQITDWVVANRERITDLFDTWTSSLQSFFQDTNWQAVVDNAFAFGTALANIPWGEIVEFMSQMAANIDTIAVGLGGLIAILTGGAALSAIRNMAALLGGGQGAARSGGRNTWRAAGWLLSRLNPLLAIAGVGGAVHGMADGGVERRTDPRTGLMTDRDASAFTVPAHLQRMQGGPDAARLMQMERTRNDNLSLQRIADHFDQIFASRGLVDVNVRVEGAAAQSVGVRNTSPIVGNVGTNIPSYGGSGPQ